MDRIIDKAIVFVLCCGFMLLTGITNPVIVGMLVAVCLSAAFELPALPQWVRIACPLLYCLLTLFIPSLIIFLPLASGDLFKLRPLVLRMTWLVPVLIVAFMPEQPAETSVLLYGVVALSLLSCLLAWRGDRIAREQENVRIERDTLSQLSSSLELRNRDLHEHQELELKLATLNERSRIAREIHDNVGHLLTRSVLQVKALTVVHANDATLAGELEQVSATLNTAFEAVRASVHDLHDEAYSLQAQLEALAQMDEGREVQVEFRAEQLPSQVAYSFLAIVREALSNVERHSDATCTQISVVEFPGLYQLTIHDNGTKISNDPSAARKDGIGLSNMEERVRALGGIFRTSYNKGFKVFVSVPKVEAE